MSVRPIVFSWYVVSAICAAIGCAGPRSARPHQAARPKIAGSSERRSPEGPPCGPGGPTMELKTLPSYPGKPPHRRAIVEAHVRNPLASPVWLLYDIGDGLPSIINRVTVSRTSPPPGAHVWSFYGDGLFEAVRLPPGADLVLCELELNADSDEEPFLLAFATSITMGDRPAESWAGQAGLSPASGDFTVTGLLMAFERKVDGLGAAPLVAPIMCVKRFDEDTTPVEPTCGAQIDR